MGILLPRVNDTARNLAGNARLIFDHPPPSPPTSRACLTCSPLTQVHFALIYITSLLCVYMAIPTGSIHLLTVLLLYAIAWVFPFYPTFRQEMGLSALCHYVKMFKRFLLSTLLHKRHKHQAQSCWARTQTNGKSRRKCFHVEYEGIPGLLKTGGKTYANSEKKQFSTFPFFLTLYTVYYPVQLYVCANEMERPTVGG